MFCRKWCDVTTLGLLVSSGDYPRWRSINGSGDNYSLQILSSFKIQNRPVHHK